MTQSEIDFQPYLRSLIDTYQEWWKYYTLTDATGQIQEPEAECPSPFDFGLTVQTVAKEKDGVDPEADPRQEKREKTERLPVLEGIRKYADQHVLLVGRPGSGKSTALIRLLLEMAALTPSPSPKVGRGELERIPILVELRYWESSILERMRAFLGRHDPGLNLDDATLTALLRQGRFLLLMDGLNELPSEKARTQLAAFRRDYAQVPMIFTTRDLGLGGDLGIEKKLEMQPLTETQMKEFIRAYVPEQAEVMLRQLSDRLREFGKTPLLLWMLCEVFQQSPNHQMPSNLAGVFQTFTGMYENRSVRKHEVALLKGDVRPLSDRRLWKPALQALAAVMMQGETLVDFRVAIHRDEAERELSRIFPNEQFPVRDVLDDLLKYHLLQNRSADQLEFRHQLIQEYYAAEYLLRLLPELSDEELKRDYLNYLKWMEPIALMLALVDEETQALRVVKLAMDDVDLMLGAKLIGRCTTNFQDKLRDLAIENKIPKLVRDEFLRFAYPDKKILDETAIAKLIQDLTEEAGEESRIVAYTLAEMGHEAALKPLLKDLNHKDSLIRQDAAEALAGIRSESVVSALNDAISDEDYFVQESAIYSLAAIGTSSAKIVLTKTLEHESDFVRKTAIEALEAFGNEREIDILRNAFVNEMYVNRNKGGYKAVKQLLENPNDSSINETIEILQEVQYQHDGVIDGIADYGDCKFLPILWGHILEKDSPYLFRAVFAIQNRYKFYNYKIWQEAIEVQNSKLETQKENTGSRTENHQHFYGNVSVVTGNVEGNQNILPPHSID